MKLTKCPNGHFYDADKHPECPYCNGGLEAGSAIARPGAAAEAGLAAASKGPVAGWLVVLDGPARGQDLRLGEGRNFLGVDAAGNPAVLDANSPLAVRRGIVVYDPQDNNWCALPGSSNELCTLNGKSLIEKMPLAAGDTFAVGRRTAAFCAAVWAGVQLECSAEREEVTPLASEIILTVSERRNRQKLTLSSTAAPFVFGRGRDCSFVLRRNNVGEHQFTIEYKSNAWLMQDAGSTTCGTWYNNRYIHSGEEVTLQPGDVIGLNTDGNETTQEITFRVEEIRQGEGTAALRRETPNATVLRELDVRRKRRILIGRGEDCDVQLTSDRVSRHHCEVVYKDGHYELNDLGSTNGTYLNGTRVRNELLTDGAVINVPTQVFAFSGGMLHYHEHKVGISIELLDVYKTVKNRNTGKPLNIVDGTSMGVEPNSFVVVVGGSGTGKSSLLGCITGASPCTSGSVCFDGIDTRGNRNAFDAVLGCVPQKDIMHDELTVEQSLTYTAKLRIARDATRTEIKAAVAHAIEAVDLGGREKTMIANLSGGQKKRVSIAMELLASPRLLILDEPTSGLSPDLDRSMMELCRKLSHENCTVLMVTHNMSNINLCDKIAFLGTGGVLCYYGSPEAMDEYFDVELTSDIFEKLHDPEQVEYYRRKYFTSPEFNRLAARFPAAAKEAEKRCKA